jgi:hypothetical protein
MLRIPGGGHNTLLAVGKERYFEAIAKFIAATRKP